MGAGREASGKLGGATPEELELSRELEGTEERLVATVTEEGGGTLSDVEREELEARFREELQREHEARMAKLQRKQESVRAHQEERLARERARQVSLLRDSVRMRFYRENGYQRIEENGRERWIPAEEYAARQRARPNTRAVGSRGRSRYRMVPLYLLLALVAMAIGAFLVR